MSAAIQSVSLSDHCVVRFRERFRPAFDHDVPAPTATRWPARASARTDATA